MKIALNCVVYFFAMLGISSTAFAFSCFVFIDGDELRLKTKGYQKGFMNPSQDVACYYERENKQWAIGAINWDKQVRGKSKIDFLAFVVGPKDY